MSEVFCQTRQIPADALSATGSFEASHEELSPACSVVGRHSILNKRQIHLTVIKATKSIERAGSSPVHLLSIWCCVCLVFLLLVLLLVFLLLRMHK